MLALHWSLAMALADRQIPPTCCLRAHRIDPWITDSKECCLALLNAEREPQLLVGFGEELMEKADMNCILRYK